MSKTKVTKKTKFNGRNRFNVASSLCFKCTNGYAHKCSWIAVGDMSSIVNYEKRGKDHNLPIIVVKECKKFKEENWKEVLL